MGFKSKKESQPLGVSLTAHLHYRIPPFSTDAPVLTGSSSELGEWDITNCIKGTELGNGWWTFDIHLTSSTQEFKFVIVNENKDIVRWEESNNHTLHLENVSGHYLLLHQWACGYGISKLLGEETQVVPAEESILSITGDESFDSEFGDLGMTSSKTMPDGHSWLGTDSGKSNTLPRSSSHSEKHMEDESPASRVKRFRSFRKLMSRTRRAFSPNPQ